MKRARRLNDEVYNRLPWMAVGFLFAILSILPSIMLKGDSVVTYHDQLDGEILSYIIKANHLFDNRNVYQELMNGIPVNGLMPPAPFFVLIFRLLKPFTAFIVCTLIVRISSILSMFLFLDELTNSHAVSFALATVFMLLPFYTVYGLCITGQPIIYYIFLKFRDEDFEWPWYFAIVFYGTCSSFSLGGYAVVVVSGVVLLIAIIKKTYPLRYLGVFLILTGGYVLENIPLVEQALGASEEFVSHKSELVHVTNGFFASIKNSVLYGANYTEAYQRYYLLIILLALGIGMVYKYTTAGDKEDFDRTYGRLEQIAITVAVIIFVVAIIESQPFTTFINSQDGIIHDFNFSRFSWLLTVFWFAAFALSIKVLWLMTDGMAFKRTGKILVSAVVAFCLGATAFFAIRDSDLKNNLMKIVRNGDYHMVTWNQFFAPDLFDEVDELIGREKAEYRVVSLGIYPAAATYNGFYCLDAYSNNYDVNYKHEFREVIAPQLAKSQYLADWFDNWGNRCYIVTNEYQNYFNVEKIWGNYIVDCELNYDKLREMGCEYLISAIYVVEPEQYGLTLLNDDEQAIETEDSWYRLFVYALN